MRKAKKILLVCNRVPFPLKDGGAIAMYAMIKGWHQVGYEVHLLAMNTSRHYLEASETPPLFRQIASYTLVPVNNDIKTIPTLYNFLLSSKPQHAGRFYHKHFEDALLHQIEKISPDFIQLESIYLHEYTNAIRKRCGAKIVQRLHNIEGEIWLGLAKEQPTGPKKLYLHNLAKRITRYEQKVWRTSDALIPISKSDEQKILDSGCTTALCTIGYGLDKNQMFEIIPSETPIAYHIGAMDWQPNIEAMEWMRQEIVPAITAINPSFQFEFAGRNMPKHFLSCQEKSFCCKGEVGDAESFVSNKDVLIVPLRSGSGIRIKTLEALSLGKLVISTSIGMQGIEAKDGQHYLKANQPQEFAQALSWVDKHPNEALNIRRAAQQFVAQHHQQDNLMNQLAQFVENL